MNEPISFRSVTDLEEVEALDDGAYIVVIENGTAKLISKENANFGGGGGTVTRLIKGSPVTREDGSAITAQEALDAFLAGPVLLKENGSMGMAYWHTIVDVSFDGYASTLDTIQLGYLSMASSPQRERVEIST